MLVDEAGLANGEFLSNLRDGLIAKREIRQREVRFITVPDFLQLPPVQDMNFKGRDASYVKHPTKYAFERSVWAALDFQYVRLTHNWRFGSASPAQVFMLSYTELLGRMLCTY